MRYFKTPRPNRFITNVNICTIFKPIITISIFSGVCCIWTRKNNKNYKFCGTIAIFTTIIFLVNCCHLIAIPHAIVNHEKETSAGHNNDTELFSQHFLTKLLNPIVVSVTSLIYRLLSLFSLQKDLPKVLLSIVTFDELLKTNTGVLKQNLNSIRIILTIAVLLSWPFQILSVIRIDYNLYETFVFTFNIYNNFSAVCCELQFIIICWLLKIRFKLIQKKLERFGINMKKRRITTIRIDNNRNNSLIMVDQRRINNIIDDSVDIDGDDNIVLLKESQHLLCETTIQLNHSFNLLLFFSLFTLICNVLLNLYFAIFGGFRSIATRKIIQQSIGSVVNSLLWSLFYFVRFCCICIAADGLTQQANSTKSFLCNILSDRFDTNTKHELWNFLCYTVVRKIRFTAMGFFKVDASLITTAVATGTTYLVILAQFHKG